MIWLIIPVVAILAPFCHSAYSKWVSLQKMRMKAPMTDDYAARMTEVEDALESAQRRIENLESIVVTRLVEDPSTQDTLNVDTPEFVAQEQLK